MKLIIRLTLIYILLTIIASCGEESVKTTSTAIGDMVIQIHDEPQRLNPILATSQYETEVFEYMFVSLCDYDPENLSLVPVLTTEVPTGVEMIENGRKIISYDVTIVPEARWKDGSPITGYDFEFTLKLVALPSINCPAWKSLLPSISRVEVDAQDPKKFKVVMEDDYFLAKEGFLSAEIYPKYVYDNENYISDWSYSQMKSDTSFFNTISDDSKAKINALGEKFSSVEYSKGLGIEGAGPYELAAWETGQYLILERKKDWWGLAYPERSFLKANPDRIIFNFIADATISITQLKAGELDVASLSKVSSQIYADLKADESFASRFDFYTPSLFRIYYILLNNRDLRLSDVNVRQALAHVVDVDRIIAQQEGGFGQRTNSIIHPSKSIYNKNIDLMSYNVEKANQLLDQSDWKDTDGDGIRDKVINGIKEQMSLRFHITGSAISTLISSVLQESAKAVGIEIIPITKPNKNTQVENLIPGDFELSAQAITSSATLDDPFSFWHSTSTGLNGNNWSGYSNQKVDELIETIRQSTDEDKRIKAYFELQAEMADDQPVIFLYAPVEKFIVSKRFKPVMSSNRPGYFANAFELSSSTK